MSKKDINREVKGRIKKAGDARFAVPLGQHLAGAAVANAHPLWRSLGRFEANFFRDRLAGIRIENPVYVCGLARAGTTVVLEALERSGHFATHRYRDYPFLDIPVLWNHWLGIVSMQSRQKAERAHLDNLHITPESPEAFEEMVWMRFFDNLHDPETSSVLDGTAVNAAFEGYYRDHVRKILLIRKKPRYLAKGNYNLTRIAYLHKLFPDAKFIVPVRDPAAHVASVYKQHVLFSEVERENPRALKYMQWSGHFEFGLDRRPVYTGDEKALRRVQDAWARGDEIAGWALYWDMVHCWLVRALSENSRLKRAVHLLPYEKLCQSPLARLKKLFAFCGVKASSRQLEALAAGIKPPSYFEAKLDKRERAAIRKTTSETWKKLCKLARI